MRVKQDKLRVNIGKSLFLMSLIVLDSKYMNYLRRRQNKIVNLLEKLVFEDKLVI